MSFLSLGLNEALIRAVSDAGYDTATDVQQRAIPPALAGTDLMVASSTGSGKTASFMLPALQRVLAARGDNDKRREKGVVNGPRVIVLTPTRELALQVAKAASTYGRHVQGLRVACVVGGVPYPLQIKALRGPLDILIATPGRLLDHLQSGRAVLDNVEMLVLDEADRMLDMGFIDDIRTIADHTPNTRQTVMYSATFAGHVGRLAQDMLRDPLRVEVASHTDTHENIEQRLHWADDGKHKDALLDHLLTRVDMEQALVFTSTQRDADWLADRLADMGHAVASLHGGHPQGRRNRVLQGLRNKQLKVLVATDVAARGIDVPTISHVINYGLPMKAEDYVHRIGRTGRAGRSGLAVTLAERRDVVMIKRIQQFTTQAIPAAQIVGLEPRQPEPQLFMQRGAPRGRPGAGFGEGRPRAESFGKPGKFGKKPGFAPRGDHAAPHHRAGEGHAPAHRGNERREHDPRGMAGVDNRGGFAHRHGDHPQGARPVRHADGRDAVPHGGAPRGNFNPRGGESRGGFTARPARPVDRRGR